MIPLIDTSPGRIKDLADMLGAKQYGHLVTPLTNYRIHDGLFAIDNGGFTRPMPREFRNLLAKAEAKKDSCKFVTVPDIPRNARRTIELFRAWEEELQSWPLALACQDGLQCLDIPWAKIAAVFIAGSDDWIMGTEVSDIIKAAKWLGKWVHIGRVNTQKRWEHFQAQGADSADGSVMAKPYPGFDGQRKGIARAIAEFCTEENCLVFSARCAEYACLHGIPEEDAVPAVEQLKLF